MLAQKAEVLTAVDVAVSILLCIGWVAEGLNGGTVVWLHVLVKQGGNGSEHTPYTTTTLCIQPGYEVNTHLYFHLHF